MAVVTITIKDLPNGMVHCQSSPTFAEMMEERDRKGITAAEGYALLALNSVRNAGNPKRSVISSFLRIFSRN